MRRTFFAVGLLVFLLALLLGLMAYCYFRDMPPPDDSALFAPPPRPGANGAKLLRRLPAKPIPEERMEEVRRLNDAGTSWQPTEKELELATLIDQMAAAGHLNLNMPKTYGASIASANALLNACRWESARAQVLVREGRYGEAAQIISSVYRVGEHLAASGENLITFLIGAVVEAIAIDETKDLLQVMPAQDVASLNLAAILSPDRTARGLADAYRGEYQIFSSQVDQLLAGRTPPGSGLPALKAAHGFIRPNATRQAMLELTNELIGQIGQWPVDVPAIRRVEAWEKLPRWRQLLTPNLVGQMLLTLVTPGLSSSLGKEVELEAQRNLLAALWALRRYQIAHGRLPSTLDALVPAYLPAVPRDPYDGRPLRYDPQRKLLWSVGRDAFDQHGQPQSDSKNEIIWPITFPGLERPSQP